MSNIEKKLLPNLSNKKTIREPIDEDFQLKCIQEDHHINTSLLL